MFISYQWDSQDEVTSLRDRLETAGFSCWMDIGQMGGGDQLYARIDDAVRNCKVERRCNAMVTSGVIVAGVWTVLICVVVVVAGGDRVRDAQVHRVALL